MPPRASQSEELPDGLVYREGFVSAEEERRLLATLGDLRSCRALSQTSWAAQARLDLCSR